MRRLICIALVALSFSNVFIPQGSAQDAQPPQPVQTEQDKRDEVVFPILWKQFETSYSSAKQVASTTGKSVILDTGLLTELTSVIDRQSGFIGSFLQWAQVSKNIYLQCSQDLTLPTEELKKCQRSFNSYSVMAGNATKRIEYWTETKNLIQSAQQNIDSAALAYLNNSRTVTISCLKGKLTKKVTSRNPKCPAGYKVKK